MLSPDAVVVFSWAFRVVFTEWLATALAPHLVWATAKQASRPSTVIVFRPLLCNEAENRYSDASFDHIHACNQSFAEIFFVRLLYTTEIHGLQFPSPKMVYSGCTRRQRDIRRRT